jgi:hypothetical protein
MSRATSSIGVGLWWMVPYPTGVYCSFSALSLIWLRKAWVKPPIAYIKSFTTATAKLMRFEGIGASIVHLHKGQATYWSFRQLMDVEKASTFQDN